MRFLKRKIGQRQLSWQIVGMGGPGGPCDLGGPGGPRYLGRQNSQVVNK